MIKLKGSGIARWLGLVVSAASVIALIIYIVNSQLDYYNNLSAMIIIFNIIVILGGCALFLFYDKIAKSNILTTLLELVLVTLLAVCAIASVSDRALSFAYIWFSDLDKGNEAAVYALNQYVACLVFYLIGLITAIVIGFFELKKDSTAQ